EGDPPNSANLALIFGSASAAFISVFRLVNDVRRCVPRCSEAVPVSRPFWPRPRQRNGTSTRRRVLQRDSKLSGGRTEESHHGIAGRGLRDSGGPRNRACT